MSTSQATHGTEAVTSTSSRATRVLGVGALAGLALLLLYSFVWSPEDVEQRDAVRLMYIHVPSAILSFAACFITTLASGMWLRRRTRGWDALAASSAEVGVVFVAVMLFTGMVWGKPTWGTYWTWDARLTSSALLAILLVGYLALRNLPTDPDTRSRRSAVLGLLLLPNVLLVHYSVDWWESLHQKATITRLDPTIEGLMLFTLMLGIVVFAAVFAWMLVHRFRIAWLDDEVERAGLDLALAERRAEAGVTP